MKNTHKSIFKTTLVVCATLTLTTPANAIRGGLLPPVKVLEILLTSDGNPGGSGLLYGGCMAWLSSPVNTASNAPDCTGNWVAFSCDGTYTSKEVAQLMLDQAQLAMVTKSSIYVEVDDSKKHNGYCTAVRMDLLPN